MVLFCIREYNFGINQSVTHLFQQTGVYIILIQNDIGLDISDGLNFVSLNRP